MNKLVKFLALLSLASIVVALVKGALVLPPLPANQVRTESVQP